MPRYTNSELTLEEKQPDNVWLRRVAHDEQVRIHRVDYASVRPSLSQQVMAAFIVRGSFKSVEALKNHIRFTREMKVEDLDVLYVKVAHPAARLLIIEDPIKGRKPRAGGELTE